MTKINNPIEVKDVFHQPAHIPQNLIIWQDENHGVAAIVNAANDMLAGKIVRFALCTRESNQTPIVEKIITLRATKTETKLKISGEIGECALIPSWYDYNTSPAHIGVMIALKFSKYANTFFRLK